jgi:cytochrome c peroxidase
MTRPKASALVLALLPFLTASCEEGPARPKDSRPAATKAQQRLSREPIQPLPEPPREGAVERLGRKLFHEKRLSSDGSVACSTCHDLERGGDDGRRTSVGVQGRVGGVNAPTVYNASLNFAQFWDGRAATLEEQAKGPLTNPLEMNTKLPDVVKKLAADPEYAAAFREAFPDGVTEDNVARAIAAFERTLLSTQSPFDRWLQGDAGALGTAELTGYELFKSVGCIACHQGRNVGGNMFQRFGVLSDYFKDKGKLTEADYGRFNVTKNEADRFVFRVPSLRNVEHTAPYFHDGSAETLEQAVQVMAKYQLGRELGGTEVSSIVAFLRSLSGASVARAEKG